MIGGWNTPSIYWATPFATAGEPLAMPMPRKLTDWVSPWSVTDSDGAANCRSSRLCTALSSSWSPESAVAAIGTSCRFSSRRCAVTMIGGGAESCSAWVAGGEPCAATGPASPPDSATVATERWNRRFALIASSPWVVARSFAALDSENFNRLQTLLSVMHPRDDSPRIFRGLERCNRFHTERAPQRLVLG